MSKAYKTKLYVLNETNLYKILGVAEDSNLETISKAYKSIAKELHPDLNQDLSPEEHSQAAKIFQKITASFNTLKDNEERSRYDSELKIKNIRAENLKRDMEEAKEKDASKNREGINPDGSISFTFKKMKFVDMEKAKEEKEKHEKEKATSKFEEAKKLISEKKYDQAVELLRNLTESFPNEAKYHSQLGLALDGKGWGGYAQAEFKVALHYDPNDEIAKKYYTPPTTPSRHIKNNDRSDIEVVKDDVSKLKDTTANLKEILGRVRGLFGKK
ncbi:MAG: DnaJ domain-containing protein [Candidatus Sericytochromatia bacterium]